MKPTRILHFIDALGAGGTERQLVYLLEHLDRARYECYAVTTYDHFRHYEPVLRQLDIPLCSLHHGELNPLNRVGAVTRYISLMWSLRPQIVHSWLHYPNLIARASRPFCPSHRLLTAIRTEYSSRQQASERWTSWLSDIRIVINNTQNKNTFKEKTLYIANGVYLPADLLLPPESPRFTILMVARIDPRKDHLTLLHALTLLPEDVRLNTHVILVGESSDLPTQRAINSTIETLSLQALVTQQPPTYEIQSFYAQTDVTILPSRTEGFPNVILESFAAARPIIVSHTANRNHLVEDTINGWTFPTGDSLHLAHVIEAAYRTPRAQRTQMGLNGREVAKQYSIENMVNQYAQLYHDILRRS